MGGDLNGLWNGWYSYLDLGERVPFTAWLDDDGGSLTGSTMEPNTLSAANVEELEADVTGNRSGASVMFTKRYRPGQGAHSFAICYQGLVESDFCLFSGDWRFENTAFGQGRFLLERASNGLTRAMVRSSAIAAGTSIKGVTQLAKRV
ncbi:MAG: hypothetical protein AAFR94_07170 [Pseudomonadota bacterium]